MLSPSTNIKQPAGYHPEKADATTESFDHHQGTKNNSYPAPLTIKTDTILKTEKSKTLRPFFHKYTPKRHAGTHELFRKFTFLTDTTSHRDK
jgi:hypothetical protein